MTTTSHRRRHTVLAVTLAALLGQGCSDDSAPTSDAGADAPTTADPGADATAAADQGADASATSATLRRLAAWMTGGFDSKKQSQQDPAFLDITLVMKRIWPTASTAGYWLYVEQSVTGSAPYRQRVYELVAQQGGTYASKVYEFARASDRAAAVGAWQNKDPLSGLTPQDLVYKSGCEVVLTWDAKTRAYTGSTGKDSCKTTFQGASYTTSQVQVTEGRLSSWDRGFDAGGKQVWGAVKGPYIFELVKDLDPGLDS